MVDASVTMQDRHTFLLSLSAVAPIHAVIRTVVPLAGEHVETLWEGGGAVRGDKRKTCAQSAPRMKSVFPSTAYHMVFQSMRVRS